MLWVAGALSDKLVIDSFMIFLSVFTLFDGEPFFTKDPDLDADNSFSCIVYVPHEIIFFSVTLLFTNH